MKKSPKIYKRLVAAGLILGLLFLLPISAFATTGTSDPLVVINNLQDFIFAIIKAIGFILLGFGILQIAMSFSSHDPTQRMNGFLAFGGGLIIFFVKEILDLITG